MRKTNKMEQMKSVFKATLAVVAVAATGMGTYKGYGAHIADNTSTEDLLLAENIVALASGDDGSSDDYVWIRGKQIGTCYARRKKGEQYDCSNANHPKTCKVTAYTYTGTAKKKIYEKGGYIKKYLQGNVPTWNESMGKCNHLDSRLMYEPSTAPDDVSVHSCQGTL